MNLAISYMAIALVEKSLGNWRRDRDGYFMIFVNVWQREELSFKAVRGK
jgi:hypothetical protein